ncbi:MAG: PKD domain-containing protein [Myxococcales bacterium]|nr:PKD domain-containing protein [Myxococcales bacterium]
MKYRALVLASFLALPACGGDGTTSGSGGSGNGSGTGGDATGGGGAGGAPGLSAPTAVIQVERATPLVVSLDGSASSDEDGTVVGHHWDFGDGSTGEGALVEHSYAAPGCYDVTLEVTDDDGLTGEATRTTRVIATTAGDATAFALTGLPKPGAVLPRDLAEGVGYAHLGGQASAVDYETLVARVHRDTELVAEVAVDLCGAAELDVPVPAELASHRLEVVLSGLGEELALGEADDVVAGDVYLVNGQSNAVSAEYQGSADENLSPFVRSFGARTEDVTQHLNDDDWHPAASTGVTGAVGQWPLRMAAQLSSAQAIPIAVINGARGGVPIGYFARNDADHTDPTTNYGRLLDRAERAGVIGGIRAILFYQGESDGPDATAHHDGFTTLYGHWQEDFPGLEQHYITQIRVGCGGQIETREAQRQLAHELERTAIMSTTGLDAHDGCHFGYAEGYRELGDRYANLLLRDLYGVAASDVEAVDVTTATLMGDSIVVETASDATALVVDAGVEAFFQTYGGDRPVAAVAANGSQLVLTLGPGNTAPSEVAFVGHSGAGPWVLNAGGVGLLAFRIAVQ